MGFFSRLFNRNSGIKQGDIQTRYTIEHSFLPKTFLDDERGLSLINKIFEEEGSFFIKLFKLFNVDNSHYVCPYSEKQFSVEKILFSTSNGNKLRVVQVQMPKPEKTPLCEKILFVLSDDLRALRYITVEKDEKRPFICEWKSTGDHVLYGEYTDKNMIKILDSTKIEN